MNREDKTPISEKQSVEALESIIGRRGAAAPLDRFISVDFFSQNKI